MKILVTRRTSTLATFFPREIMVDWLNHEALVCSECGCQFMLEEKDRPKVFAKLKEIDGGPAGSDNFISYFLFCPEGCGEMIEIGSTIFPTKEDFSQIAVP